MIHGLLCGLALAQDPVLPEATDAAPIAGQVDEREALRAEMRALRAEIEALRQERLDEREEVTDGVDPVEAPERDGSRTGFGEPVRVDAGEEVEEVVSFGEDVEVSGRVLGDAVSFGGNVIVNGSGDVGGDAVSFGGKVIVREGGAIHGDRVAMAVPAALPVAPIEPIEPTFHDDGHRDRDDHHPIGAGSLTSMSDSAGDLVHVLYRKLVWLMSIAGAGVLVVGLFPQRVTRVAADVEARPVRAAVVGSLATGFLLLFSLLFTIVTLGLGLPIGLLLVGILGAAWLFGFVGLCQAIGDRLPFDDRPHGRWLAFLVGIVLVTFLGSLPWIGWLVVGSASVLGIGSALSTRFGRA